MKMSHSKGVCVGMMTTAPLIDTGCWSEGKERWEKIVGEELLHSGQSCFKVRQQSQKISRHLRTPEACGAQAHHIAVSSVHYVFSSLRGKTNAVSQQRFCKCLLCEPHLRILCIIKLPYLKLWSDLHTIRLVHCKTVFKIPEGRAEERQLSG